MNTNQEVKLSSAEKAEYLYQSIADLQGTIRAIDAKIAVLMVILSLPFSIFGKIYSRFFQISVMPSSCAEVSSYLLFGTFAVLWFLSFAAALQGIIGIDNPTEHIDRGGVSIKGSFYNSALFKLSFHCILRNKKEIKSLRTLNEQVSILPKTESDLLNELSFEQMKLSYIRDMKQKRQYWAYRLAAIWLFAGLGIYIVI